MNTLLRIGVLGLCIAFGACAEMRWTRPGADANQASRDLDACRGAALQRSGPRGADVEMRSAVERGTSAASARPAGTAEDRFIAEHEEVRTCMLQRGYQLRPAT